MPIFVRSLVCLFICSTHFFYTILPITWDSSVYELKSATCVEIDDRYGICDGCSVQMEQRRRPTIQTIYRIYRWVTPSIAKILPLLPTAYGRSAQSPNHCHLFWPLVITGNLDIIISNDPSQRSIRKWNRELAHPSSKARVPPIPLLL